MKGEHPKSAVTADAITVATLSKFTATLPDSSPGWVTLIKQDVLSQRPKGYLRLPASNGD